MDFTCRFKQNTNITFREEGDGAFLFDPETGNLKYMNQTAKEMFLMLDGRRDVAKLTESLHERYPGQDLRQICNDLEQFLKDLQHNGYIFASKDG